MIKIIYREHEFDLRPGMALLDALKKIDILPETIISTRNGEVITEDEFLLDGDVVLLISVISGG